MEAETGMRMTQNDGLSVFLLSLKTQKRNQIQKIGKKEREQKDENGTETIQMPGLRPVGRSRGRQTPDSLSELPFRPSWRKRRRTGMRRCSGAGGNLGEIR